MSFSLLSYFREGERNTAVWVAMDYAVDEPVKRTFKVEFLSVGPCRQFEKIVKRVTFSFRTITILNKLLAKIQFINTTLSPFI